MGLEMVEFRAVRMRFWRVDVLLRWYRLQSVGEKSLKAMRIRRNLNTGITATLHCDNRLMSHTC